LRAVFSFIFTVDAVVLSLAAAAVWIARRPASRTARRALAGVALFYVLFSTYGVTDALGRLLVLGFAPLERADVPPGRTAIVVLGSGSFTVTDWDGHAFSNVDPHAASRVLEAVRVFRLAGADIVVSSGGKVDPEDPDEATGVTMREALIRLGVPSDRVLLETVSRNTHDEAMVIASMRPSLAADHLVLVTTDMHMRRSLGAFRAAGLEPIPAIARTPFTDISLREWVLPSGRGLWRGGEVMHEVAGIVYYRARGWYK
jgi:uncharacterized SAM-binding protein YcdF (DUF218 family)